MGTDYCDVIDCNGRDNTIHGMDDYAMIEGVLWDGFLRGGTGSDTLTGGLGADTFSIDTVDAISLKGDNIP